MSDTCPLTIGLNLPRLQSPSQAFHHWSPASTSQKIPKDSGFVYISQNAARYPASPLEPLFRSLYAENPSFDISSVDLVTDKNNLRKLLSFISQKVDRSRCNGFCIDVEVESNTGTVLFYRVEDQNSEVIGGNKFVWYGQEFRKAYAKNEIEGSTGHYRVVSYRFGGMNLLVMSQTDAYVGTDLSSDSTSTGDDNEGSSDIPDMAASTAVQKKPAPLPSQNPPHAASKYSGLLIKMEGRVVPITSTLEIRTCARHDLTKMKEITSPVWLSQTGNLAIALHEDGVFDPPEVGAAAPAVEDFEEDNQVVLKRLAVLIKKIIEVVKENGQHFTISYRQGANKLVILKNLEGWNMLPHDLYCKFEESSKRSRPEKE
ncbi:hypothetical protein PHISCL_10237 [Aspergillus sclerotialis]|uniref:Decapping nuclease n=1 Tax=Aspergillus sclerotialis TaxID=2070753 RepID=A0A3A2Z3J2_9EURO|nr:hypothetical protein PHISCL_10237 [Aspergillus sclerotialis]